MFKTKDDIRLCRRLIRDNSERGREVNKIYNLN